MRKYIAIILVLIGLSSQAQPYLVQSAKWQFKYGQRFDSAFRVYNLPILTGDTVIGFNPYSKKIGLKITRTPTLWEVTHKGDSTDRDLQIHGITVGTGNFYSITNTALGYVALNSNVSGVSNVAIGRESLTSLTTGSWNTSIGGQSLNSTLGGYANTGIGYKSLKSNNSGAFNIAIGSEPLIGNTTGNYNIGIGFHSLYFNSTSSGNIALGNEALDSATGQYNIGIGYGSGGKLANGQYNILMAHNATVPTSTTSNFLNLGNIIYGTGINETVNYGKVGIRKVAPSYGFDVNATFAVNRDSLPVATNADSVVMVGSTGQFKKRPFSAFSGGSSYTAGRGLTLNSSVFRLDTANFLTLLNISKNSTTAPNSIYNLSAGIPVNFKSSDGNSILYLDETNENVAIGGTPFSSIYKLTVVGDQRVSGALNVTGEVYNSGSGILNLYSSAYVNNNGNFTIGSSSSISRLAIPVAPTASSNYGLVSLGNGAFNGSTLGYFTGNAAGTLIAGNLASGSTSDLMNLQVGGVSKFKITSNGTFTCGNASSTTISNDGFATFQYVDAVNYVSTPLVKSRNSSGIILLSNITENDFSMLKFGGTTSSFPALKKSSTTIQVRLADDSGDANLSAKSVRGVAVTFANVPTPVEGMILGITDSTTDTWGATITGGGSLHVLAYYNGTNWTVFGK